MSPVAGPAVAVGGGDRGAGLTGAEAVSGSASAMGCRAALPVCGDDGRLHGIITDRDIVIRCLAAGGDPQTVTAGELARGKPFAIGADASAGQVLRVMEEHRTRRLPVIDNHRLVGMISEADLTRHLPEQSVAEFVETVCASS